MVKDLTQGKPWKVILIYAVPIIIGTFFQQVYNMVDTIIVGRFISYGALAGVGATNGMSFLALGFNLGITSGLGIKIAQFFGARDMESMRRSVGTSLIICAVLSIVVSVVAILMADPLLRLIGTPEDIFGYSHDYIIIIFGGLLAQIAYNMVACILRALGDSRTPLYFLIFSSVLNLVLDLLFILVFNMGVKGAAIATVIAQFVSAALCFIYAFRNFPELKLRACAFRTDSHFVREHLVIGLPMAFQFSIVGIGLIFLQHAVNTFPSTYIAGFTAANKIQNVGALVAISLGTAIANFTGQNYGAKDFQRVRAGVKSTLVMCMMVCVVSSTLIALFAGPLTSLFLSDTTMGNADEIYYASGLYLYMTSVFFPALYLIFVYRNALQGMGLTFWPLMASIIELFVRAVGAFTLPVWFGYPGVTLIDMIAWITAAVTLVIAYRKLFVNVYFLRNFR